MNEDYIDRKAVIDELKQQAENMAHWSERYAEQRKGILTAINIVSDLPSVTPQPRFLIHKDGKMEQINPQQKTGHWIYTKAVNTGEIIWSECSECGNGERGCAKRMKYCPDCGARMEAKKNE